MSNCDGSYELCSPSLEFRPNLTVAEFTVVAVRSNSAGNFNPLCIWSAWCPSLLEIRRVKEEVLGAIPRLDALVDEDGYVGYRSTVSSSFYSMSVRLNNCTLEVAK